MPVIEIDVGGPLVDPNMLPVEVGFGPVGPFGFGGTPEIPIEIGLEAFDFGVKVTYTCPGFPLCGKAGEACKFVKASPVIRMDPLKLVSIKIPGIPAIPKKIGPFGVTWMIPPPSYRPFTCPNYPEARTT